MKKFLILYLSPVPARQQMAQATPEQAKGGMDRWMAWAQQAGRAIVDLGGPLGDVGATHSKVVGFSILQANSTDEIERLLKDHPHNRDVGGSFEVHEFLEIPGMSRGKAVEPGFEPAGR
ncbi:MAG TPA: hypothetical protein VG454_04910 [Gemmatimonadales bacterium]|nr:hypothetical protein [Gemmatimonadales bacterium]